MDLVDIYPPYLKSIKYDDKDENEFDRLLDEWSDMNHVLGFLNEHKDYLKHDIWSQVPTPESAARQIRREAADLEELFDELDENCRNGSEPDFDSHFKYFEGDFKFDFEYIPMKSYGSLRPSLIRLYAIKLGKNQYIITGGGIKLADKVQNSPLLCDTIIKNFKLVRTWLEQNGIQYEQ